MTSDNRANTDRILERLDAMEAQLHELFADDEDYGRLSGIERRLTDVNEGLGHVERHVKAMEQEWEMSIVDLEPDVYVRERTRQCSSCLSREARAAAALTAESTQFDLDMLSLLSD
jgi:hypothetical protein